MSNKNRKPSKSWLNTFSLLLTTLKSLALLCCLILMYGVFGDKFDFSFNKKDSISSTKTYSNTSSQGSDDWDKVENGIHIQTGLIYDENFDIVRGQCTACHSGKLIAQNRATREGWTQMIRWMQETQGLWELGSNEPKILDYLAKHYAPTDVGRRANIDMAAVEWYILEIEE